MCPWLRCFCRNFLLICSLVSLWNSPFVCPPVVSRCTLIVSLSHDWCDFFFFSRLHQSLHKELPSEGTPEDTHRWENLSTLETCAVSAGSYISLLWLQKNHKTVSIHSWCVGVGKQFLQLEGSNMSVSPIVQPESIIQTHCSCVAHCIKVSTVRNK